MRKRRNRTGLTLIELMVSIVAASILILIVGLILIMAFRSWHINNAYVDLRRNSALAFYRMARDVREADYDNLTEGNPLILPSAVPGNPTIIYAQSGSALTYDDESGTMSLIPENVQGVNATKQNDGVLLTLELADADFGIAITNQVFVNTRN